MIDNIMDFYNNKDNEGHILVALYNYGDEPVTLEPFERVAQGVFQKYSIVDNDNADQTRTGGIGSTGTNKLNISIHIYLQYILQVYFLYFFIFFQPLGRSLSVHF